MVDNGRHNMKKLEFNNKYHLGDCIFSIIYFNKVLRKYTNSEIIFYCNSNYHKQLKEICEERILLKPFQNKGESTWIGRDGLYHGNQGPFSGKYGSTKNTNEIYVHFYNYLSSKCGLDIVFETKYDILYDSDQYLNNIDQYDKNYDIMVINSVPLSGQFQYSELELNNIIIDISEKYKVITTKKVNNIDCTLDMDYSILDIAKLAYYIDKIITIHTAPHILTLNKWTINKYKRWIVFDNHHSYDYDYIEHYTNLNEMKQNINNI